jgi:hypothetical protein
MQRFEWPTDKNRTVTILGVFHDAMDMDRYL